jgi:sugar phosphate isomerase/epimerase
MTSRIGVLVGLPERAPVFKELTAFGLRTCQLVSWNPALWTADYAATVRAEAARAAVLVTAFWAGWPGPAVWDLVEGPATLGLVPPAYRAPRVATMHAALAFAHAAGIPAIITHLGFIPEWPKDPLFGELVAAVKEIADHAHALGLQFWFETGQETPVTMLRLITCVGTDNLGINLDPANLISYGRGNPIDALDVFGAHVRNVHAKDALYPTDPMHLGQEVQVGAGRVRFPEFVARLREIGFTGEYIIEREISGPQQAADIRATIAYLEQLVGRP